MSGKIYHYLADDHTRLDRLLQRAIDASAYAAFRAGLLKHIAMEEKVLLARGDEGSRWETASHRIQTPSGSWGSCRASRAYA